jgi:hypothetical protein
MRTQKILHNIITFLTIQEIQNITYLEKQPAVGHPQAELVLLVSASS